ncbi:MAG: VUT family protein [Anaerolineales bacterium]|nr:VUT family protein [Anaerolineales bacterium]
MLIFLGGLAAVLQFTAPMGVYWRPLPNIYLTLGSNVLVPVILLGVLLIYVTEGTAPARLAIWGIVGINLLSLFTLSSLSTQLNMPGGGSFVDLSSGTPVLHFSARQMTASMIAFVMDMCILAILYQGMINRCGRSERLKLWNAPPDSRAPIWLATIAALLGALWVDALVYTSLTYAGTPALAENLSGQLVGKTISGVMLWPFAAVHLDRWASKLPDFNKVAHRRSFDMLFGSYAQLENALVRSEEALLRRAEELAAIVSEKAQYASDLERSLAEMSTF